MMRMYVAILIATFGAGIYLGKVQFSKTETVNVEHEIVKNNVITVTHEVSHTDGTHEVITTVTDKSTDAKAVKQTVVVAAPNLASPYHISASASTDFTGYAHVYGLQIERKILGPFSIGVRADTNKQIGIVVGYEF